MGMIPARLTRLTVGLIPTSEHAADGERMDPSVSVPMAAAQRLAAAATAEPELEPEGVRSSAYGLRHCPPRPLQPLEECVERKFAHSLRLVLPRITAPAARSRLATNASRAGIEPARAREPAVVIIRSAVAMLSLRRIGMPCSGPRAPLALRSASSDSAIASASGFSWRTERTAPSSSSMRARYRSAIARAVYLPE